MFKLQQVLPWYRILESSETFPKINVLFQMNKI